MQDPWCEEAVDHALPPTDLGGGKEITPDNNANDQEAGRRKKTNWPSHMAEITHTYNATLSTVTGCSPHYLMFGQRPRLPVNFYFPTVGSTKATTREASTKHVDKYIASVQDRLRTALWEVQTQLMTEHINKNSTMTER